MRPTTGRSNLAPLPGAARQGLRRQLRTNVFQLGRNRIQKRRCSAAHCFAIMELGSKNLSMKAFSFGIFRNQFRRIQNRYCP
jgi:hypothetical protein